MKKLILILLISTNSLAHADCRFSNAVTNDYAKNLIDSALSTLDLNSTDRIGDERIILTLRAAEYSGQNFLGASKFLTELVAKNLEGDVLTTSEVVSCTASAGQSCQKRYRHKDVFKATRHLAEQLNCLKP